MMMMSTTALFSASSTNAAAAGSSLRGPVAPSEKEMANLMKLTDLELELMKVRDQVLGAHARVLQDPTPSPLKGVNEALDVINKSIDIFNKISDIVIDKEAVSAAKKYISENSAKMMELGATESTKALEGLASQAVKQLQTGGRIKTMAVTLKKNAVNVKMLFGKIDTSTGTLDSASKKMLQVALALLFNTLNSAITQCSDARKAFEQVQADAAKLQATMAGLVDYFTVAQRDGSKVLDAAMDEVRKQAYISCAASCAFLGPICTACFAAAVPIVEAKIIPDLKNRMKAYTGMLDGFKTSFTTYGNVAAQYVVSAGKSVSAIGDYTAIIVSVRDFVEATSDIDVAIILVDEYKEKLDEIIDGTDEILAKIPVEGY
jgi:hypothetical protein